MSYFDKSLDNKSRLPKINSSLVTEESLSSIIKTEFGYLANQKFYEIEAAEVLRVITSEEDLEKAKRLIPDTTNPDISYYGAIKARQFTSEQGVDEEKLPWRFPLNSNFVKLPIKGETVLCVDYRDEPFYVDVVNRKRNLSLNVRDTGLSDLTKKEESELKVNRYQDIFNTDGNSSIPDESQIDDLGYDDNGTFKPLVIGQTKLNPGDTVLQGRFGNVIRLSSEQDEQPNSSNIKMSTGQLHTNGTSVEDDARFKKEALNLQESGIGLVEQAINTDASSLYLTENETIDLTVDLISKVAPGRILSNRDSFSGAQLMGNSDNIVFNARLNDVHLFANQNINLTARDRINFEAPIINLGDRTAAQRLVKGDIFIEVFKTLLISLKVFANRLTDVTAPNPNNSILELEMAATKLREQIDSGVLPFLEDTLSNRNFTS
jgi:hypothetical protein|tara:strand:- start:676 stop:1977 length:1302 start_codon:yes stop_codon:yes gene_type:complete